MKSPVIVASDTESGDDDDEDKFATNVDLIEVGVDVSGDTGNGEDAADAGQTSGAGEVSSEGEAGEVVGEGKQKKKRRRKKLHRSLHKKGGKDPAREKAAEARQQEKEEDVKSLISALGDPFDNMDWTQKKHMGLHFFLQFLSENPRATRSEAAEYSSSIIGVAASTVLHWVIEFSDCKTLGVCV